jgi:hypothetical protein
VKSKLLYDLQSVSQYVLASSTLVGLATRYYFLSECCCLKFAVLYLLDALSDESTGLQFAVQSLNGPCHAEPVTILYCLTWDSPNLEGQVPVFISPRNRMAQLYPRALGSLYVVSYDSQGYGGGILTLPLPGGTNWSATFIWYVTDRIEDESNNSSIVVCVFVTAITSLCSRWLPASVHRLMGDNATLFWIFYSITATCFGRMTIFRWKYM